MSDLVNYGAHKAIVCGTNGDGSVNLAAFNENGGSYAKQSVWLQGDGSYGDVAPFAEPVVTASADIPVEPHVIELPTEEVMGIHTGME